jgi:hypothetical protein
LRVGTFANHTMGIIERGGLKNTKGDIGEGKDEG